MIPDCDMEHRTWPEGPGALAKCSHILGWKERRYYSAQRSASVELGELGLVRPKPGGTKQRVIKQKGEMGRHT